jgi:hypothetical protein
MAGSDAAQKNGPPVPIASRPLKTGAKFVIVLPKPPLYQYLAWDASTHNPGDAAKLKIHGSRLPNQALSIEIEQGEGKNGWSDLSKLSVTPGSDTDAEADWTVPALKPVTEGLILDARWDRRTASPGDEVTLTVTSENEQGFCVFEVEKMNEKGEWEGYNIWQGDIQNDKAECTWIVPGDKPGDAPKGTNVDALLFDVTKIQPGDNVWMKAKASADLEGQAVTFRLEKLEPDGRWSSVGEVNATVKSGAVRGCVQVPGGDPPPPDPITLNSLKFEGTTVTPGGTLKLTGGATGLDGKTLRVTFEGQLTTGEWVSFEPAEATVANGVLSGEVKVPPAPEPPDFSEIMNPKFHNTELAEGERLKVSADTTGMEGAAVIVTLEVAGENGVWERVDEVHSTVQSGGSIAAEFRLSNR